MSDSPSKGLSRSAKAAKECKLSGAPDGEYRDPWFKVLDARIAAEKAVAAEAKRKSSRKRRPASKPLGSQAERSGKPSRTRRPLPPLPPEYLKDIVHVAREHRRKFSSLFAASPTIRDRGARVYRSLVWCQRRGRKPSERVVKALQILRALGRKPTHQDWRRIYLECIPDFPKLHKLDRRYEAEKLRRAVAATLKRARNRSGKRRRQQSGTESV